jgi:hypothetical protein
MYELDEPAEIRFLQYIYIYIYIYIYRNLLISKDVELIFS